MSMKLYVVEKPNHSFSIVDHRKIFRSFELYYLMPVRCSARENSPRNRSRLQPPQLLALASNCLLSIIGFAIELFHSLSLYLVWAAISRTTADTRVEKLIEF